MPPARPCAITGGLVAMTGSDQANNSNRVHRLNPQIPHTVGIMHNWPGC